MAWPLPPLGVRLPDKKRTAQLASRKPQPKPDPRRDPTRPGWYGWELGWIFRVDKIGQQSGATSNEQVGRVPSLRPGMLENGALHHPPPPMNNAEPFSCKWRRCGLPWHRRTTQMQIVRAIRKTKSTNSALSRLFAQLLPQVSSKVLPFPAILFVPRLSWMF
jgi:hypothetical protein